MDDQSPGARRAPEQLDARLLAECLESSPTWARLGLAVREHRLGNVRRWRWPSTS